MSTAPVPTPPPGDTPPALAAAVLRQKALITELVAFVRSLKEEEPVRKPVKPNGRTR